MVTLFAISMEESLVPMISRCAYGAGLSLLFYLGPAWASPVRDCPGIVSNLERLACFDEAARTPARVAKHNWSAPEQEAPSVLNVLANEVERTPDDLTFHMRELGEGQTQPRVIISAPAIASVEPRTYLAISCIQNISRLQLIAGEPFNTSRVKVQLKGERSSTVPAHWQVMENGQVLDAGRGLPAIEQIKALLGAHRIRVTGDHSEIDGLTFDAEGLDPLIDKARKTCRW